MEELIKLVSQKTGLPEATARKAVETVMEFLKERIPEPLGSQLEGLLDGSGGLDLDSLGDIATGLGNLFGGK